MISGLPSRPLYQHETEALTEDSDIDLAFPASPESIDTDDDGNQRIQDLLLFIGDMVAAIAYVDEQAGWELVTKETDEDDDAYEIAYDKLLEYRGYDYLDRETAMKQVIPELYGIPEDLVDANPDELDSLEDL